MTTRAPAVLTNENHWKIFAYYLYSWRNDQDTLFFSDKENCKEYLSRLRGLWYLAVRLPERRCHFIGHWENKFANWVSTLRVQSLAADWRQPPPLAERRRASQSRRRGGQKVLCLGAFQLLFLFPALDSTIYTRPLRPKRATCKILREARTTSRFYQLIYFSNWKNVFLDTK